MGPDKISGNSPLDEIYRKIVLQESSEEILLKEGSTKLVQHLAGGHPVAAVVAETVGPVYVDAVIEEIPRYADDFRRFQNGLAPREENRPGEYYIEKMHEFFDAALTRPLQAVVGWFKDLLRRDGERASRYLR